MGCGNHPMINYQGFNQTYTTDSIQTTITYKSNKDALTGNILTTSGVPTGTLAGKWKCGYYYTDYGRLDNINFQQADGPFYTATLTYTKTLSAGVIITTGVDKPTQNSLTVRMLSMPIETHPNYKYCWNHSLATCQPNSYDYSDISGMNAEQAHTFCADHTSGGYCFMKWIQNDSELPTDPFIQSNEGQEDFVWPWRVAVQMTKPGVQYYEIPTYEITEYTRHSDRKHAAWCISVKSGKLKFPEYGDFGLEDKYPTSGSNNYRWLCLGGDINYDGKYYVAKCTYQWSPDPYGWDQQIWEVAKNGSTADYGKVGKGANPIL